MKNGSKLKELIEATGMTQKEFAAEISIAPTTLSGYINSAREPDLEMLLCIANKLSVSLDYLMNFCYENDGVLILNPKEVSFVERLRRLNPSQQETVSKYVDFLSLENKS